MGEHFINKKYDDVLRFALWRYRQIKRESKTNPDASVVKTGGLLTPIVDGTGYISHFATCPFAKYHRGRGCAAGEIGRAHV